MHTRPLARFDRFAVGGAGVVEIAGAVAATAAVDHTTIGQAKNERVTGLGSLRVAARR
jgi:hypothetical protein